MDKTTAPKSAIGFLIGWSAESETQSAAVKVLAPLPGGLNSRARCIIGAWSVSRCLIACLVIDSIASTKPSSAIARLHKRHLGARWRVAAATPDFYHKVEDILRTLREAASS